MNEIVPINHHDILSQDADFLARSLGVQEKASDTFHSLLNDPEAVDVILDSDSVYQHLLSHQEELPMSSHLYYFVVVRRALQRVGIDHRQVADYLAGLLGTYAQAPQIAPENLTDTIDTAYLVDLLRAVKRSSPESRFYIRAHIGNYALFLTGLFPERLPFTSNQGGVPDLLYYEELGRSTFLAASKDRTAWEFELNEVFELLGTHFHQARIALYELAEQQLFQGQPYVNHSEMLSSIV